MGVDCLNENPTQDITAPHIGTRLQRARRERGMRLIDVARGVVSVGYLSMIEQGQRRPSPEVVRALAKRLDVDIAVLEAGSFSSPKLHDLVQWQDACWTFVVGDFDAAAQQFADIIERQSTMVPAATRWLARTLFSLERTEEALRLLRRPVASLREPHDRWTAVYIDLLSGMCLLRMGDLEAAEVLLQSAATVGGAELTGTSMHLTALAYLGRCRVRRGFMQGALAAFKECSEQLDLLVPGGNLVALARGCRETAVNARDNNDLVSAVRWNERANILMNVCHAAEHGSALALEISAFHLRLETPDALDTASVFPKRILMCMTSAAHAESRSRSQFLLAEIALRQKDGVTAKEKVQAGMHEDPNFDAPWAAALRAQAEHLLGNLDEARSFADEACALIRTTAGRLRRSDSLVEPWECLADLYQRLNESEKAWECMREAAVGAGIPKSLVVLTAAR